MYVNAHEAKEAALKSLQIDDTLAEAHHCSRAGFIFRSGFRGAIKEFQRAIDLDPNYATAHHCMQWTIAGVRRFDEAIAEGARAVELDPLSPNNQCEPGLTITSSPDAMTKQSTKSVKDSSSILNWVCPFQPWSGARVEGRFAWRYC